MLFVITGGGTGGHIFPALEIAREFLNYDRDLSVIYVGNKDGLEERLAKNAGLPFFGLRTKKLVGQSLFKKLLALLFLGQAVIRSLWFLVQKKPQAVVGVGGYISAPMLIASFLLGIPRFIAEQNVEPGFANKALGKLATGVFLSFAQSASYFKAPTLLTGNPIRQQFFSIERVQAPKPLRILVCGGSLGAVFLNEEVPKALALVKEACPEIKVTHQTGAAKLAQVKDYYERENIDADVIPFIENMPEAFAYHDLLISRAGATVIAELMAAALPAVLVPFRHAGGHQKANAKALADVYAAKMVEEGTNFAPALANIIKAFYYQPEDLMLMGQRAKAMATPHASLRIVKAVLEQCV